MTQIYHITHIDNLANIIDSGYLWSDNEMRGSEIQNTNIGHRNIKERRAKRDVNVSAGGVLADYVPFYFAPRSPMLYVINSGGVEDYTERQTPVLHLVAEVDLVVRAGKRIFFTDRHAELAWANYYEDITQIDHVVDWNVMQQKYWSNTEEDRQKRQAEFLVYQSFEWTFVQEIGVISSEIANQVNQILQSTDHRPQVRIIPSWYYQN